jgi:hypothetical protein
MRREMTTVAVRRAPLEPSATNPWPANPASPMVLQGLMQILADLNRKVDALATRPPQEATVGSNWQPAMNPAVKTESPADATALATTPAPRINRLRLRDIFD